jgi:outer membrane biosynthesis protein TonB
VPHSAAFVPVLGSGPALVASTARVVAVLAAALVIIGIVLFIMAIRLVRATRSDHAALGPLEVLGDRAWHRHDLDRRAHDLDKARPIGAAPEQSGAFAEMMPVLPIDALAGPDDDGSDEIAEDDQTHDIVGAKDTTPDDDEMGDETDDETGDAEASDEGSEWAAPAVGAAADAGTPLKPPPPPQPGPLEPEPAPPLPNPLPEPLPLPAPLPDPMPEPIPGPVPEPDPLPEPQPYPAPEPAPEPEPIPEPGPDPIPAIPMVPFEGAVRVTLEGDPGAAVDAGDASAADGAADRDDGD